MRTILASCLFLALAVPVFAGEPCAHEGKGKGKCCPAEGKGVEGVKVGGQIRTRAEMTDNDADFNDTTADRNDFTLMRVRLSADVAVEKRIRAYVELQDARQWGGEVAALGSANTLSDNQGVDLHQGYAEFTCPKGGKKIRLGRQEMNLGDQRLVGSFDWSNNGRSFDGIRFTCSAGCCQGALDVFWFTVNETNKVDTDQSLGGIHKSFVGVLPGGEVDVYYLLKKNGTQAAGEKGTLGSTTVHTLGGRVAGRCVKDALDYGLEAALQQGEVNGDDLSAYTYCVRLGYTAKGVAWKPRVGVEWNTASGDDNPADGDAGTFDNLYPTNHQFYGYADLVGLQNVQDIALAVSAHPAKRCRVGLAYHVFSLAEEKGAWYRSNGTALLQDATGISGDEIGNEIDLTFGHKVSGNVDVEAGYSLFLPGDFVKKANGTDDDTTFGYVQVNVGF